MLEEYYRLLGLEPDADEKAIKKAYRVMALKYHPDVNPQADATEKFQQICEAYEILISREAVRNRVFASQQEEESDIQNYEEIIREAREKAAERARMKYEKIKAEKDFFENNDVFVFFRYAGNYLAVPLALLLIFFPVIKAVREGAQMFFGLFYFWIIGGTLLVHIYSKRKTWFRPGKISTTWKDVTDFFKIEKKENPVAQCHYSRGRMADSTPFRLFLFKVRDFKRNSSGRYVYNLSFKRTYREVIIPRSSAACRVHFILSFIKPVAFLSGLIFFPVPSIIWRFIASFLATWILSRILLFAGAIHSRTSYLFTPFMILKMLVWLLIIISQTTCYPGLVLYTTEILPFFLMFLLLFLDIILDITLRIFPFYPGLYAPVFRQPAMVMRLIENGYQNYQDVPIWTTLYPFLRWLV